LRSENAVELRRRIAGALRRRPGYAGWTETILHAFQGGDDGYFPKGGVKLSANGVLYGTTSGGGASSTCSGGCGTVFSLTPPGAGQTLWKHAVLHAMTEIGGSNPSSSLISDASGNLYGTALLGGTSTACSSTGCGTVFRVLPPTSSAPHWVLQTLHDFSSGSDSEFPTNAVLLTDGKLWGATAGASPIRLGATFTIAPPPAGGGGTIPVETIIHMFQGGSTDGATPSAGLTLGVGGVLYGVTSRGGSGSHGVCGDGCGDNVRDCALARTVG
jgi:uncharacterized repeat protein (TIGR03803 family)